MIAVISLTEQGRQLSARIAAVLPEAERWCFHKHTDAQAQPFTGIADLTAELFDRAQALVFVCAAGIAVRAVSPHLQSKASDPAVVVLDERGQFVIPVLSGHLGGANALARQLADALDAVPVITTATDTNGRFSPDCYAAENGLALNDLAAAKEIAAAVLDGEAVGFVSRLPGHPLPAGLTTDLSCRTGLCITENPQDAPFPVTLQLMPRDLVLGIGCKKDTSAETIARQVQLACEQAGVWPERLYACATISLKAQEAAILALCRARKLRLVTYTAEELMAVPGDFTASDFVRETTGADNVCERSAVLCSGGTLLLRKSAGEGVTVAIAEKHHAFAGGNRNG